MTARMKNKSPPISGRAGIYRSRRAIADDERLAKGRRLSALRDDLKAALDELEGSGLSRQDAFAQLTDPFYTPPAQCADLLLTAARYPEVLRS